MVNHYPAGIYLFKVNNKNTRTMCEICPKFMIKTIEQRHWHCFGIFIVNFEKILHNCSSVSIVPFEKVNARWVINSGSFLMTSFYYLHNMRKQIVDSQCKQCCKLTEKITVKLISTLFWCLVKYLYVSSYIIRKNNSAELSLNPCRHLKIWQNCYVNWCKKDNSLFCPLLAYRNFL